VNLNILKTLSIPGWALKTLLIYSCALVSVNSQTPAALRTVVLISEVNSTRAIAFDSVTLKKEPFSLSTPFAADGRTRVMVFALNLDLQPGEDLSVITAEAEDAAHRRYSLGVEYAAPLSQLSWLSAVVLRLNDELVDSGDVLIQLRLRGNPGNRVRLALRTVGGGPADDDGATPTPAPPYFLSGRVTGQGGTGIGGVTLTLNGDQVTAFITNADGNFSFLVNTFGSYSLSASKMFFDLTPAVRTFNNLSNSQTNLSFNAIRRTHTVTGRVFDDINAPLSGISVSLLDQNDVQSSLTTGPDGRFSFAGLPEGLPYRLSANATPLLEFGTKNIDILLSDTNADLKGTRRSYQITGTVKGATNNVQPGLEVTLSGFQGGIAVTDINGRFSFPNLIAGHAYALSVQPHIFYDYDAQQFSNLLGNADVAFTGTLRKYVLFGTVTLNGAPASNHVVQLSGTVNTTTTTNSAGEYSFPQLDATGNYLIAPAPTALRSFPPQLITNLSSNRMHNFSDVPRRYLISGAVSDPVNRPVVGISMNLGGNETATTRSGMNGTFSLEATVLGDYTLTPTIEQDYYEFTPQSQSIPNLLGDSAVNPFTAILKPIPTSQQVLEFDGTPKSVDYGNFFPEFTNLGNFFWEFWAMPRDNASSTYMLSDGYGGLHALLFGFSNFNGSEPGRYEMFGNINDGVIDASHVVSFGSDHGPAINEWGHFAVGWDGQNIITYFNGVPVGKTPYAKPRKSTGPGTGSGRLLIGGSDHSNFRGRIAQVRGFEDRNPRTETSVESSFAPETVFGVDGNLLSYYFVSGPKVADLSNGYRTGAHTGTVRGTTAGILGDCGSCPPPLFVSDPTAPNFALNTPAQQIGLPNPAAVPSGALAFDSFSRANSTYVLGLKGGLGVTEGGLAGVQQWQMLENDAHFKPFGILNGRGVVLADDTAVAWLNLNSSNLDVRVNRKVGRWGSGTNTGLSFRVVDANNYFFAYTSDSIASPGRQFLTVGSVINGVRTTFASGSFLPLNWTTLRVVTRANGSLSVVADSTPLFSTTTPVLANATRAGLFNNARGLALVNRWDNFTVFDAGAN
jgi:hypothetical protein